MYAELFYKTFTGRMLLITLGLTGITLILLLGSGEDIPVVEWVLRALVGFLCMLFALSGMLGNHSKKKSLDIIPILYGVALASGILIIFS